MLNMHIKALYEALKKSWSKETSYTSTQKEWSDKNPAFGHCAVTALIVQDYFGGELLFCKHHNHYWNRLSDGREIDLTRSQFDKTITICLDEIKPREYVLESESAKKAATLERYILLKHRINSLLNKKEKKGLD